MNLQRFTNFELFAADLVTHLVSFQEVNTITMLDGIHPQVPHSNAHNVAVSDCCEAAVLMVARQNIRVDHT
jgi:hypothetical protein